MLPYWYHREIDILSVKYTNVVISKAKYLMFSAIAACLSRLVRDHRNLSYSPEGFPIQKAFGRNDTREVSLVNT